MLNTKKAAIYARVSSALQEKEKTIQSQLAEMREICKCSGVEVVKEYVDDGYSGEILDRPALDQLRVDARKGLFEAVYVQAVDRLSRNLYHQGILVEELKKCGVEIFIGNKPIADTPEGKFMFNILGAVAEYEKEKILERTRRGRLFKAREKGIVGHQPPYGYDYVRKSLRREGYFKINEKETEIVKLIFELYIALQSISRVQKELTLRKIGPRKGGERWCRSTIRQILKNEAYTGTGYYNKRQSIERQTGKKYQRRVKTGVKMRPKEEWIEVRFPQIIEKKKFELAQEILSRKYKPFGKSKYFYLLSGLIRCANCNYTFTGSKHGRNFYYRCSNRTRRQPFPQTCHASVIKSEDLDNAVWKAISNAVTNSKILIAHISHLINKASGSREVLEAEKSKLVKEKEALNQKKDKLLEAYLEGLVTKKQYLEKAKAFEFDEEKLTKKLREIEFKSTQAWDKSAIIENIQYFCNLAKQKLQKIGLEEKRRFLRYLIDEIILDSNKRLAKVVAHIPLKNLDSEEIINQDKVGLLYMASKDYKQDPNNYIKFELEVKI
jgi:site-specific DNA recombinase